LISSALGVASRLTLALGFLVSSTSTPATAMFRELFRKSLVPWVKNRHLKCEGADCENNGKEGKPLEPIDLGSLLFVVHFILSLENKMRTLKEILIGALVFISIDRLAKVISRTVVDRSQNENELKKSMLRVEVLTLFVALFIAIQFIKV
jgi:hypothetical protein